MSSVLTEIIQLLTGGIQGLATAVGSGLQSLVTSIFIDTSGQTQQLSVFGGVIVIFAGVSLAIGLCTLIFHWLTSMGARN